MSLEAKDYATFALSAAALTLSVYNFVRSRFDADALNQRTFEQKRFEAITIVEEIQSQFAQIEREFDSLHFDGLLANNSTVVEVAGRLVGKLKALRSTLEFHSNHIRTLSVRSNGRQYLLDIEKTLGEVKAIKANVSQDVEHTSNLVQDGRRLILETSRASSQSSPTEELP
jgi:hypothetical protein